MISELVSIIVPVHNSENFIGRCLDSIINQTYNKIEIIIINDGSKDNSLQLINEYIKKDKRIKVYSQKNQGPSVARNTGLNKSKGKYIMFVDADDYIDKKMVECMIAEIDNEKSTLVLCDNSEIWLDKIDKRKVFDGESRKLTKNTIIKAIASGKAGLVCGKLFSKSIIDKYQVIFDKDINMCEDQIFFLEICRYCELFRYVQKSLYFYDRRNENSITIKYKENAMDNQINVISKIEEMLNKSDLSNSDIDIIINNRFLNDISDCINNEILDTNIYNLKYKVSNIKNIIENSRLKERITQITPSNKKDKIIVKSFKNNSYILLFIIFYIQEIIILPIKKYIRKFMKL